MLPRPALILALLLTGILAACSSFVSDTALRQAIHDHPDMVLDALKERQAELFALVLAGQTEYQDQQRQARQTAELRKPLSPAIDPNRAMRGPANAPVTVVVYSDFFCPHCAEGATTLKQFLARHPDTVRVLNKHFAIDELSRKAAIMYEALAQQDPKLAFAFADALFASQTEVSQTGEAAILALAVKVGANIGKLKRALNDPALAARVDADVAEATKFGITGTPTFLVNGVSIRGAAPLSEFEDVLRRVSNTQGQEAPCAVCDKQKQAKQ